MPVMQVVQCRQENAQLCNEQMMMYFLCRWYFSAAENAVLRKDEPIKRRFDALNKPKNGATKHTTRLNDEKPGAFSPSESGKVADRRLVDTT